MREIKFRAFDANYKKMLTPKQLEDSGVHLHASGCLFITDINDKEILCERLEAMQFTGLHDKNGREIYEGDIIKQKSEVPEVVVWDEKFAQFLTKPSQTIQYYISGECEVIGNIHENPELVEQKGGGR